MAAATKREPRLRRQPPARGKPYYDVAKGRTMILPAGGGKAVPYIEPAARGGFDAKRALRRAGVRAGRATVGAGDRAARGVRTGTVPALKSAGAWPSLGSRGAGGLVLFVFGSIIGLALLRDALGGRGPAAVQIALNAIGGGFQKLVSPTDPIVPRGQLPPPAAAAVAGSGGAAAVAPGGQSAPALTALGVYTNPVPFSYRLGRTDQGLDLEAGKQNVGQPILAVGKAKIVALSRSYPGFGQYVGYRLLNGPAAGRVIYVGHSRVANLKIGDVVPAGAPVAYVQGYEAQPGHIELGFASPTDPYTTLARARSDVDPASHYSSEGASFATWFLSLFGKGG
jgi:hypothetical protein